MSAKPMTVDSPVSVAALMEQLQRVIYEITCTGSTVRQIANLLPSTDAGPDALHHEFVIAALGRNIHELGEEAFSITNEIQGSIKETGGAA
jgi:hypothetical protein